MAGLSPQERSALNVFKKKVTAVLGSRLHSVQLFGSKARGEARPDSDVDVLVILNQRSWEDEKKIFSMVTSTFLETDVILSPKVFSAKEVAQKRRRNNVFFQAIDQDLVAV